MNWSLTTHARSTTCRCARTFSRSRARALLEAAKAETLVEFDQRGCYVDDGMVNVSSWLAHHTGVSRTVAGGRVKLAKRLRRMPVVTEALREGHICGQHADTLGRCRTPRTEKAFERAEQLLVEQAMLLEADDFSRLVTEWISKNDVDATEPHAPEPTEAKFAKTFGGRGKLDADLDPEDCALIGAELDRLYEQIY